MNSIIFSSYHLINGTLFDVFEYYISMLENDIPIKLIILNDRCFYKFYEIFEEKYILDDLKWKDNILILGSKAELLKYKFNTVILFDYTSIQYCSDVLIYNNLYIVTNKINYKRIENAVYFTELWQQLYYDIKYVGKFIFHRYKEIPTCKHQIFLNILGNAQYVIKDKPYFTKNSSKHFNNLYSLFDEYVYVTDGSIFDCHPRLFHECYFYGKKIVYINYSDIKDGAYYRYMDLMDNGLTYRYLDMNDELLCKIVS